MKPRIVSTLAVVLAGIALSFHSVAGPSNFSICDRAPATTLYVKAHPLNMSGTGSKFNPFNTLAEAEAASLICDTIIVLHSPANLPALDGGITLKDGQQLIGTGPDPTAAPATTVRAKITNSIGDAIILANDNLVSNLHIDAPGGAAIVGDNIGGTQIQKVLITEANRLSQQTGDDVALCDTVGLTVLRGCFLFSFVGVPPGFPAALAFLHDDNGPGHVLHTITDTVISDVVGTGIWINIAGTVDAGLDVLSTRIENTHGSGVFSAAAAPGIFVELFQEAELALNVHDTEIERTGNDGIAILTGFFGSPFIPGVPLTNATLNANFDAYSFVGSGSAEVATQTGIEMAGWDFLSSTHRLRMRNSDITQALITGVQFAAEFGGLADSTIDLGCVDVDNPDTFPVVETCQDLGLDPSPGNNRIFDNGFFLDPVNAQMIGPVSAVGQGNWWGDPAGLDECQVVVGFPPPPANCLLFDFSGFGFGAFDARFHLTEDPRP
jgi:hypothetical protein